jgi:hypothetical protein
MSGQADGRDPARAHGTAGPHSDVGTTELEKLAAELDGQQYEARLVIPPGRRPFVYVCNRRAGMLKENIYAGDGYFWFGWAERVAAITDVSAAAEKIARVLRAVDTRQ